MNTNEGDSREDARARRDSGPWSGVRRGNREKELAADERRWTQIYGRKKAQKAQE